MKVKITKASTDFAWYASSIGKVFEVEKWGRSYVVTSDMKHDVWRHIEVDDCEVVVLSAQEQIVDELVVAHIFTEELAADPKKAIAAIVEWNVKVATDPATNGGYRLIKHDTALRELVAVILAGLAANGTRAYDEPGDLAKRAVALAEAALAVLEKPDET